MARTALYGDAAWQPPRASVQLDADVIVLDLPGGRRKRHSLDGCVATAQDGFVARELTAIRRERRFVRMLELDPGGAAGNPGRHERHVYITPPDEGTVAPNVVRVPEAPSEAAILDGRAFDSLSDWVLGGGRLAAFSIPDLARLAQIASSTFAAVIGEVCAQRALEIAWDMRGPLRNGYAGYAAMTEGGERIDASLQPLIDAAKRSSRASEALVAALSLLAGSRRRRRRW